MNRHVIRLAVGLWIAALVVMSVRVMITPTAHTLYPTYADAGSRWFRAQPLYGVPEPGLDTFRYAPAVAAALVPWSFLPDGVGAVAWRWFQAVTFLLPLWAWARQQEIDWAWLGILTLPLTLQSLNNGQVNPLVAGLLLSTLIAFASERWTWAAAFVSLAFLLKGYPLALGLLLMLLEPWRFGPRLLVMVVLGLAIPFALQSPAYVVEQYNDWLARLGVDDRSAWPAYAGYQDFALLLRVSVGPCPRSLAHALGLAAAFACAVAVLGLRWRGLDRQRLVLACGDLAIGWMLLFGPATETCTYTLLAAPLALRLRAGRPSAWLAYGLLLSALMALWFPKEFSRPVLSLGVQPLGALIYLGGVVVESWSAPVAGVRSSRQLGA